MATNIKNLPAEELIFPGNGACGGCPAMLALKLVGKALGRNAVMTLTPSCSVASMGVAPKTAFNWPALNITFASAGSSAAGIAAGFEALQEKGRYEGELPTVFNWTGDGGTYDIGFQALSAAAERNDNLIHFCYNNEAYSNTGMQRSGATPRNAYTTTTPAGKPQAKKNMARLMLEHGIPYVATASLAYPGDLYDKVVRAKNTPGFKYIEIFAPCYTGWGFGSDEVIEMARLANQTCAWPLWEGAYGKMSFSAPTLPYVNGQKTRQPVDEYLKRQTRFQKIFRSGDEAALIAQIQNDIDQELEFLIQRSKI